MSVLDHISTPAEAAKREGPHSRIVLSSRVRLARNAKNWPFPGYAKKPDRVEALKNIRPAVETLSQMQGGFSETMDNLTALDKQILVERHLISREHAAKNAGSGLVISCAALGLLYSITRHARAHTPRALTPFEMIQPETCTDPALG